MKNIKGVLLPFSALKFLGKKPHTVRYPIEKKKTAERYRGFHYNDIEECIGCGTCATICQNEAIDMIKIDGIEPKKGDSGLRPRVDNGRCCWCGLCVEMCPTGSLSLTDQYLQTTPDPDSFLLIPGVDHPEYGEHKSFVKDDKVRLLQLERVPMKELDPNERVKSFAEVVLGYMQEEARREATRCIDCGICVTACPDHMHIPEYIGAIADAKDELALKYIYDNNPLPEMCGKVCTRQCETVCAIGHLGEPIAIRWLKRYATEQFPDPMSVLNPKILPPNGKKVGIIGGGPAGLSAGYYLALRGFDVTIYEALPKAGGMTFAGIPKYRFPEDSLDKQVEYMKKIGVKILTNTRVGKDISFEEIRKNNDAVFIGIGFHVPYKLGVKGEELQNSIQAIDFLRTINLGGKVDVGKRVVVIGGGNVAIDAARVARRLGAEVTILYRRRVQDMPADWEEIEAAEHEGVEIIPQGIPLEILGENDKVTAIKYGKAEMVPDPRGGRPRPQLIEGDERIIKTDTVIGAIGQEADYSFLPENIKNELKIERGRLVVNEYNQTSLPDIFAGGDNVNRTMDAISAIADGVRAMEGITRYLLDENWQED
ncbi:MAG TPA: 4Fe-4S dicluster domain-containing protein [Caldithrix abyssi]|uniref:4Fe-4S dicluster domain-containing protein n=2 Tax=Caldithrix abyssi TaxID=187145 RepID=A0A7V5PR17_CALAY|nr:4Fe-4S dicluster domain-containing protein [Caldithrix abyssi]